MGTSTELVRGRVALAVRVHRLTDAKLKEMGRVPEMTELDKEEVQKEVIGWDAKYKKQRRLTRARAKASAAVSAMKALLNDPRMRESWARTFDVTLTSDELQLK